MTFAAHASDIKLSVQEDQGVARQHEIVSGGIPFPQGRVHDPADLQVYATDGSPLLTQAHQLGISWPDGSLRWALVQFPANVESSQTAEYRLATEGAAAMADEQRVSVEKTAAGITVDTGMMRFSLPRKGYSDGSASFLPSVTASAAESESVKWLQEPAQVRYLADREHMTPETFQETGHHPNTLWSFGLGAVQGRYGDRIYNRYAESVQPGEPRNVVPWHDWSEMIEENIDYSGFFSGPMELEVEEAGPVRAVVHFRSARDPREGEIGYSGRLYAYAGSPLLRVELTVENYEQSPAVPRADDLPHDLHIANTKHVREFKLRLRPAFDVHTVQYGVEDSQTEIDADDHSRLVHENEKQYRLDHADETHVAGQHAPGWISVSGDEQSLSFGTKYFEEIYPKAVGYDAKAGEIVLELWPDDAPERYPFTAGRVRTYEFVLGFDVGGEAVSAAARAPLRPYPEPEYMASTDATPRFVPLTDQTTFPGLSAYIERGYERFINGKLLYGDIHFGDQSGWSRLSTASGYHGVGHEFAMWYLSSGDPAHFRLAEAAVWHNIDIDQFHWGDRAGEPVKQHTRYRDHLTIRPMGGIGVWNAGDVLYYFLTGSRRVLPTLEKSANFLLNDPALQPDNMWQRRSTSLPAIHLAYMLEAIGDERSIAKHYPDAYQADAFPHRMDANAEQSRRIVEGLSKVVAHLAELHETRDPDEPFQQSGFQASYPAEAMYRFWRLTGDERARRGVILAADYLYKEYIHVTGVPMYRYMPGLHAPEQQWRAWYDEVDLPAARAYEVTGEPEYLQYAWAPLDWRLNYQGVSSDYYGFNSTIPTTLWYLREAGMTQDDLSRMRDDIEADAAIGELAEVVPDLSNPWRSEMRLEGARVLINQRRFEEAREWLSDIDHDRYAEELRRFESRIRELEQRESPQPE